MSAPDQVELLGRGSRAAGVSVEQKNPNPPRWAVSINVPMASTSAFGGAKTG